MLKPNSLTSLRNPSSSSGYFFQNLIQPKTVVSDTKNVKTTHNDLLLQNNSSKENHGSLTKSKRVQQLAEEVANLLVDEQGLMTEVEKGEIFLSS